MMTDRQRVEALFFPVIFRSIIKSSEVQTDGNAKCLAYIEEGIREVLDRVDDRKKAALWRRVIRAHDAALDPEREGGVTIEKAGMIGFYMLSAILEDGYLELEAGSKMAVAIEAILEALAPGFSEARLDASARKQAAKTLRLLQREGYFEGVTPSAREAA
ncbi:MAG: hypothetical protein N2444_00185 [Methylocystis sp.]|nr:hypothetical protein [Methylocystis sp.]